MLYSSKVAASIPHCCITATFCIFLQYDAFDIGFITTDDFTNADILEATYPAVAKRLHGDWISDPAIPIVTGFLGKVIPCSLMILSMLYLLCGFLVHLSVNHEGVWPYCRVGEVVQ